MRFFYCFLFCFLLHSISAAAQDKEQIASLEKELSTEKTDSSRVNLMSKLFSLYRLTDSAKAMSYANDAISLARKCGFKKGESLVLLNKGAFLNQTGNNDEARELINQSLEIRKATGDDAGQGYCLRSLGNIEYDRNDYKKALELYLAAAPLFEKAKDLKGLAGDYIWIGNVFNEGQRQYNKAIEYFTKSLEISQQVNDSLLMSYNYTNLGSAYYFAKDYKNALKYYRQSISMKAALGDERGMAAAVSNLSNVYFDQKDYDSAAYFNNKALDMRIRQGDKKGIATSYLNGANIFLLQDNLEAAKENYLKAIAIGQEIEFREPVIESYNGMSRYYEKKGNASEALSWYKKYKAANDSVYNSDISLQLSTLQTQYETSKKEQLISQQKFELTKKQYWLFGSIGLCILLLILGMMIYNRNRIRQEARLQYEMMKQQELAGEAVMQAEENERKRIARDLHDGVGQMMSAAKMNLSLLETHLPQHSDEKAAFDKAMALVDESCKEVRTVSHNMMPNALIKTGLAAAVRTFIEQIESPSLKVQLYTEGLNESINKNTETVLYRVLQECVNNVIKHAQASNLDIALIKDETGINATIEDNGRGFDTADRSKFGGIGLENMQKRISFLKGTIEWQSTPGAGTLVAIYVPAGTDDMK